LAKKVEKLYQKVEKKLKRQISLISMCDPNCTFDPAPEHWISPQFSIKSD
jgi:hypothetical protein